MNDVEVTKFDDYWRTITRNEEFIKEHAHHGCPDWQDTWHKDLEDAYHQVKPLLESVTARRVYCDLPGDLTSIDAENYHHALVLVLNPPERWFGNMAVLRSPKYLELKRAAAEEERTVARSFPTERSTEAVPSLLERLNDTAITLLESMDLQAPLSLKEVADRAGYTYDVVRRYSKPLQEAKLIKKVGQRGFVRLIRLHADCDAM
ncbi:hypothetical protein [Planctomicrobium sp. SH664]|uniref:hypothetical protein n=1 Tax=Planctomicrobium sp. SH664 TaxID=3448125 RepID=UPI003F5B0D73